VVPTVRHGVGSRRDTAGGRIGEEPPRNGPPAAVRAALHISIPVASHNREVAPGCAVSATNRWEEG
jgi:hypothetical protein